MIQSKINLLVLDETEDLLLGYQFESVYLLDKTQNSKLYLGDIYGDPIFGLISEDGYWCLAGGSRCILWKEGIGAIEIEGPNLCWAVKVKQVSDMRVELLIDPWSENGAVWQLDIDTLKKEKIRDYRLDSEYTEDYDW
ncbi:hypothetical protein SAMN05192574_1193 [Mucilaginibacter gossypiicola]|uniref:Uncharacterized protein n=1 Tax=Mucilaginibacter gossypiicola TaxID=551995 RepID=A0A1H8UEL5_9SPHI|nr:hypothetical protein [Mucilaginibacter gossypiicola]SEP01536.1 hypothetical protein SAMN05192574_1193 [Mucilaginibacter gossypiicola]